jgi:hypothetical protein
MGFALRLQLRGQLRNWEDPHRIPVSPRLNPGHQRLDKTSEGLGLWQAKLLRLHKGEAKRDDLKRDLKLGSSVKLVRSATA